MVAEQQEADKNRTRRTEAAEVLLIYEERKTSFPGQVEGEWFCPHPLYLLPFMNLIHSALVSVWKVEPSTWILGSQVSWDKPQNPVTLIRDKPRGWMDGWMDGPCSGNGTLPAEQPRSELLPHMAFLQFAFAPPSQTVKFCKLSPIWLSGSSCSSCGEFIKNITTVEIIWKYADMVSK